MQAHLFESKDALNHAFAERLVAILSQGIAENGRASLLVSGGRTPLPLFKQLSETNIDWSKVDISLVDERWVDETDEASNTRLVKENLLQGYAASANFVEIKTSHAQAEEAVATCTEQLASMQTPFDALILGMGEDGHTASLFPCSEQVQAGLDLNTQADYIAVQPTTAPHQRMSLTLKRILASKHIFLHLTGDSKKAVLDEALAGDDALQMPIRAVLNNADVQLMWAP
ncbi:6-phosphogluconolactonase [Alteromonas sp. a30]|uniref:6-phosphogluconolactonase n=1 Tax=Alteromonas sp. a30 TaxID=2730917 RepID=UPI0022811093|nr:6-phosphogluconolactonase [Alteromonas sp. a30]MCY7294051.1 6-phosphogluconolactonase [Alteromonas sp. a30]